LRFDIVFFVAVMPVKTHIYRAIAELNASFEKG